MQNCTNNRRRQLCNVQLFGSFFFVVVVVVVSRHSSVNCLQFCHRHHHRNCNCYQEGFSEQSVSASTYSGYWLEVALVETATGQGHTQLFSLLAALRWLFSSFFSRSAHHTNSIYPIIGLENEQSRNTMHNTGLWMKLKEFSFHWNPSYAEKFVYSSQMWPIYKKKCKLRKPSWKKNNYFATFS